MALDLTKPLRTTDGAEATYVGRVNQELWFSEPKPEGDGYELCTCCESDVDMFYENVPERRTLDCWLNIYDDGFGEYASRTREQANRVSVGKRIACVHIQQDYEVGEGLS